ncbi:hypothetical protein FTP61_06445 [Salmonella enterica]|nr:hypothetical protein [Salmonella enterica]
MSKTLNPTITITVSGPTGSGKSRVLAVIADVLKLIHSDCIIEAPDVKAEKEMCGGGITPRGISPAAAPFLNWKR